MLPYRLDRELTESYQRVQYFKTLENHGYDLSQEEKEEKSATEKRLANVRQEVAEFRA